MTQSIVLRWEARTDESKRYYRVVLQRDLLGDLILMRVWGGIGRASGQLRQTIVNSVEDGFKKIDTIIKQLIKRGYELTSGLSDLQAFQLAV